MRLVCWWAFGCSSPCAFNLHRWLASCLQHRERESRVSVFPCQYIAYPQQVLCSAFSWLQVSMGAARPQNRTARAKLAWPNGRAGGGWQKSQRLQKRTRSSLAIYRLNSPTPTADQVEEENLQLPRVVKAEEGNTLLQVIAVRQMVLASPERQTVYAMETHNTNPGRMDLARVFEESTASPSADRVKDVRTQTRAVLQNSATAGFESDPCMTECLTLRELVEEALKKIKQKAPGSDGITNGMLKHLGPGAKRTLLRIYNQSWSTGTVPTIWKEAVIRPIPKNV